MSNKKVVKTSADIRKLLTFNETTHEYSVDGKKLISVTQLMRKHGLAPDYTAVKSDILNAAAERGTLIHGEIEAFIKTGAIGFTAEAYSFAIYAKNKGLTDIKSEIKLYNDIVAGTADLFYKDSDGAQVIADIKTTSTIHRDAVAWQLSIYNYLAGNIATKAQAWHFDRDSVLKVINIQLKPVAEVERLLQCERDGVLYTTELKTIEAWQLDEIAEAQEIIEQAEAAKKEAEARVQEVREAIINAMYNAGVTKYEDERIKLTLVDPVTRTTIDSTAIKKELPDIAAKYSKTSTTKASIRITLKGV